MFHRMSELDNMIRYMPHEEDEECKMERSFENDAMDVTCAGVVECKGDSLTADEVSDVPVPERTLDALKLIIGNTGR